MPAAPDAQSRRSLPDLVRAYVERFEQEASALVAEEHYTQVVENKLPTTTTQKRVLRSDFVLVKPSEAGPWLGYRDVFEVDGKEVRERDTRLLRILETTAPDSLARAQRMADEGARFNLGPPRTLNVPTMPMQLLAARHAGRIRLRVARPLKDGTGNIVMRVEERKRPTIVRTPEGHDVVCRGEIVVRPDGTVVAAMFVFQFDSGASKGIEFRMNVHYTEVPGMPVLLPLAMSEVIPIHYGSGSGEAHYSNYRRFQTTARIR